MRFFSSHRPGRLRPRAQLPLQRSPIASVANVCACRRWWLVLVTLLLACGPWPGAAAQPPGTPPPEKVFEPPADSEQLPIDAFMFLSDSENQVLVPSMTWEQLQRLLANDPQPELDRNAFSYQSLSINATADQSRADLQVVLRAAVQPTGQQWVSIPLEMGNFHQVAPPDVTGVDEYDTRLLPDGGGYQLVVKSDTASEVVVRMRMSARVEQGSSARTLEFRLPAVSARVELTTDTDQAIGEVMGRGDETVVTESAPGSPTIFKVDSSGGSFTLRWGTQSATDVDPILESENRISILLNSPQSAAIATVRTTIASMRGSVERFQLRLPVGAVLLKPPQLGSTGQPIELVAETKDDQGTVYEIDIPQQERRPRIDINYDFQLDSKPASTRKPLNLVLPEIVGSLRNFGELEIRTSGDFRLRWRGRPWIHALPATNQEGVGASRLYRFRFDHVTSDFPIWLGRKESQLRLTSHAVITIRDAVASLDMIIRPGGQVSEGNLHLDEASWRIHAIENLKTEEPLDSFVSDFVRVIEFETTDDSAPAPIRVRGEFPLQSTADRVQLPLPRVVDLGDTALVQMATVDLVSVGRTVFVVDMEATKDLRRLSSAPADGTDRGQLTSHFQLLNLDSPVLIVGNQVDQPPQITFSGDARIELDGRQLRTKMNWTISSRTDLEGRLPVRIPTSNPPDDAAAWVVTVDGVPAAVNPLGDDRYELVSDRLTDGSMEIRWQHVDSLQDEFEQGVLNPVVLPRPNLADVTIRGIIDVVLEGNQRFDLVSAEAPGDTSLQLETLPRDPILIRLKPRENFHESLAIQQSILTTVIGRQTRHEQIVARVQGGDQFRIQLPAKIGELADSAIAVEGFIDGDSSIVRRDRDALLLALPGDQRAHVVDLRAWFPIPTPAALAVVEPTFQLPIGSGRVLWQIVATPDEHVIWATPTLGRSMTWQFDRWNLYRTPTHTRSQLAQLIPSVANPIPAGNRYLYVGSDLPAFRLLLVSRFLIWLVVGAVVLLATGLLTHVPAARSPLTVILASILFAGLVVVAPDAAVLAGQFAILALVLVIVMVAIHAMISPSDRRRVFNNVEAPSNADQPRSERTYVQDQPSVPTTRTVLPSAPSEAST
jgi:hypothetical protein